MTWWACLSSITQIEGTLCIRLLDGFKTLFSHRGQAGLVWGWGLRKQLCLFQFTERWTKDRTLFVSRVLRGGGAYDGKVGGAHV